MKVHLFKIKLKNKGSDLKALFKSIQSESKLRDRIKLIDQVELRADYIEKKGRLWLLNFAKIRNSHGPGRIGRDSELKGFDFDEDEYFGEETAALFDIKYGYAIIQYNHHGVKAAAISKYLSSYDTSLGIFLTLLPKYDQDVERRFLNQGLTKKLSFAIDVTKLNQQDRKKGKSLASALDFGEGKNADKIKIEISVSGRKSESLTKISNSIKYLRGLVKSSKESVTKLEVTGKESADSLTEVLDLLGQRLFLEHNNLSVGADLRLPKSSRLSALLKSHKSWKDIIEA